MEEYYLGIDIGGTNIKIVVLDSHGRILEKEELLTEDNAQESVVWKNKILKVLAEKSAAYINRQEQGIKCGIAAPGLVDAKNKMILHMPERLKGIECFNWSAVLNRPVTVINDGHAACLAEYEMIYRSKGIKQLLMLTLGTGVGGGIIINGELYQGNLQRAGHVGHMTTDIHGPPTMTNMPGSLEYAVGNFSVLERTEGNFSTVRELVDSYKRGNPEASRWWLESVKRLAVALASLTNILSPECIVLGGGITAGAGNSLMEPLKKYMGDYEWRPGGYEIKVRKAKLGRYAGAIGAAIHARKILQTK